MTDQEATDLSGENLVWIQEWNSPIWMSNFVREYSIHITKQQAEDFEHPSHRFVTSGYISKNIFPCIVNNEIYEKVYHSGKDGLVLNSIVTKTVSYGENISFKED